MMQLPFVGREAELATTEAALGRAIEGAGQIVLLSGAAGMGKTRLAEQVTSTARSRGALVAWGSCHEWEGAPTYWPWTQILRACMRVHGAQALPLLSPAQRELLTQIVPELQNDDPTPDRLAHLEPEAQLFQVFAATSAFVRSVAVHQPLVIVLDDMHWADTPTLQLLRFLAVDIRDAAVLIIATYRSDELGPSQAVISLLTDLYRETHCLRLALRGLAKNHITDLVTLVAAEAQPAPLVDAIFEETDGNPFFVAEVVLLLAQEGSLGASALAARRLQVPENVRAAIRRRVERLTPDCRQVLAAASVIGRDVNIRILARATELTVPALMDALDDASRAQLIVPGDGPSTFRFVHALVQESLYQELTGSERVRLHMAVGAALEANVDIEPHWEELAHHFVQAGPFGDPAKTLQYTEQAGRNALSSFAWKTAATYFTYALDALELSNPSDSTRRCHLLLALGDAQNRSGPGSGDSPAARVNLLEAFRLSEEHGDYTSMAQAAIGFAGLNIVTAFGVEQRDLLERSLVKLPETDSALRVRVLSRLAVDLWNRSTGSLTRANALADEAVAVATRIGDAGLQSFALWARHYSGWRPDNLDERIAVASRLIGFSEQTGDPVVTAWGYISRTLDCVEAGDLVAASQSVTVLGQLDGRVHIPYVALREAAYRGMLELLKGNYSDAKPLVERARELWQSTTARQHQLQEFVLLRDTGHLDQLTDEIALPESSNSWSVATRAHRMWLALERGHSATARSEYDELVSDDFAGVPFDAYWYGAIIPLAEAAIAFNDVPRIQRIYDLLVPFDGRLAAVGILGVAHGPVALTLGRLAAELGQHVIAERHLTDALTVAEERGMRPYAARALVALADAAILRGTAQDRKIAQAFARRGADAAEAIGMGGLSPRDVELRITFKAQRATHFGLTARELDVLRLVAEGLTDQEVAARLFLSPRTVGAHLSSIYSRLNVSSRTAAARIALDHGLV
jgi:DNA-binding NarL/FixJ family response regulator